MQTKMLLFVVAASLAANGVLGYKAFTAGSGQEALQARFPYLSKRIFVENQNDIVVNFIPLRQALNEYVGEQGDTVGVYFEYLPSGTSIGINDRKNVKIASLVKVPLVMSILKKIEAGKMSLNDVLVIKKEHLDNKFGTLWQRGEGTALLVREFIRLVLTESDNTAYRVLYDQLTSKEINAVYQGLDIEILQDEDRKAVSPKNYSSIFRSLYLSSFLSEEYSNYLLQILTETKFDDKIVAGVPKDIPVAHKIGVLVREDDSKNVFTDCGIIYAPNRPYILCMFVLDSEEQARKHMSLISKMVYGYIVRVNNRK